MKQRQEEVVKHVQIYTDGACAGNPGPGGWAALLVYVDSQQQRCEKTVAGYEGRTTNNRMELCAAIRGLDSLREPCAVTLYSDSTYVIGIGTGQFHAKRNQDLAQELQHAVDRHGTVTFTYVRGHSGHVENERVDAVAREQVTQAKHAYQC
jgi:ribonuclease HI